jgi:hypothetical protein
MYDQGMQSAMPVQSVMPSNTIVDPIPAQAAPVLQAAPAAVPAATEGSVIVPNGDGASTSPVVDPSAFVIKRN